MLINGEKYACEACVRGHRVSSCTHSDRKLLHVNKKGRPVSQCQHCRTLRKARSQHVKCECHDKAHAKEDCPHLKSENALLTLESIPTASTDKVDTRESHTCCCGHGARCNCSLKKEHLDTVPEDFPQILQPKEPHKHRISSLNNHEGKPTIFTNGHHKPVHKINDAHNHCGAPYRVPSRSHTIHGHREIAQRSTDSLPIMKSPFRQTESPLHNSVTSAPRDARKAKSEHNSPELAPTNPATDRLIKELYIPPLSPNAYSYSPFECQSPTFQNSNQQEHHLPENIPESWFTTYDEAHTFDAISAAKFKETPPIDWSAFDFSNASPSGVSPFSSSNNGFFSNQTPYATSLEQLNYGALSRLNSSSGEISEADESVQMNRPSNLRTVSNASNDLSSPGDDFSENHRLSSTSSMFGTPQANILAGTLDNLDIDEYVKRTVAEQKRLDSQTSVQMQSQIKQSQSPLVGDGSQIQQSPQEYHNPAQPGQLTPPKTESPQPPNKTSMGYIMPTNPFSTEHAFTISEAQAYAHMADDEQAQHHKRTSPLARTSLTEDPMWSGTPDGTSAFKLDDPREDEDWVR